MPPLRDAEPACTPTGGQADSTATDNTITITSMAPLPGLGLAHDDTAIAAAGGSMMPSLHHHHKHHHRLHDDSSSSNAGGGGQSKGSNGGGALPSTAPTSPSPTTSSSPLPPFRPYNNHDTLTPLSLLSDSLHALDPFCVFSAPAVAPVATGGTGGAGADELSDANIEAKPILLVVGGAALDSQNQHLLQQGDHQWLGPGDRHRQEDPSTTMTAATAPLPTPPSTTALDPLRTSTPDITPTTGSPHSRKNIAIACSRPTEACTWILTNVVGQNPESSGRHSIVLGGTDQFRGGAKPTPDRQDRVLYDTRKHPDRAHAINSATPLSPSRPATVPTRQSTVTSVSSRSRYRKRSSISSTASSTLSQKLRELHTSFNRNYTPAGEVPSPIIRSRADGNALIASPKPDTHTRAGNSQTNVAQIEASAERLATTASSINDAIRRLNEGLKRADSNRSSVFGTGSVHGSASAAAENDEVSPLAHLVRQLSNSGSIISLNHSARYGAYSPGAYYPSPAPSLTGRLRSGSRGSSQPRSEPPTVVLSRSGTGKGNVRSTFGLAKVAELEPVALTQEALDEADHRPCGPSEMYAGASTIEHELPSTDAFHAMMEMPQYQPPRLDDQYEYGGDPLHPQPTAAPRPTDSASRPRTSASVDTYEQAQQAFAVFDGAHCDPEFDATSPIPELRPPSPEREPEPIFLRNSRMPAERPQSYFDPSLGQEIIYYPAKVPDRINLPAKLKKPTLPHLNPQSPIVNDWMPGPMDVNASSPFLPPDPTTPSRTSPQHSPNRSEFPSLKLAQASASNFKILQPAPNRSEFDKRKSRMSNLAGLSGAARASVFFDLDPVERNIEAKNGSAMDTLNSILDAGASAPVSAFTDPTFVGKLGAEPHGKQKQKKIRKKNPKQPDAEENTTAKAATASTPNLLAPMGDEMKRKSVLSLLFRPSEKKHGGITNTTEDVKRDVPLEESASEEGKEEEEEEGEGEEDEVTNDEEETYQGIPTTLLAELQLRKQQQKRRTVAIHQAHPNGLHNTLLELDAVAETQRNHRKGKRVTLAWEAHRPAVAQGNGSHDEDDDDIPLALLGASNVGDDGTWAAALADASRPLGLMEIREIEENEPLSQRRSRMQQGKCQLLNRQSLMFGHRSTASLPMTGLVPLHTSGIKVPEKEPELEPEVEEETLARRMMRLRAKEDGPNALPRARPVSSSFSVELLSQFGDLDSQPANPPRKQAVPGGESETLGQRRRRLQAERQGQAMSDMASSQVNIAALAALNGATPGTGTAPLGHGRLNSRHSMADILAAHPRHDDHLSAQRQRMEEEAARAYAAEEKMAMMRSQMPVGAHSNDKFRAGKGGFKGGIYNDGLGGGKWVGHSPATAPAAANNAFGVATNGGGIELAGPAITDGQFSRVEMWRRNVQS